MKCVYASGPKRVVFGTSLDEHIIYINKTSDSNDLKISFTMSRNVNERLGYSWFYCYMNINDIFKIILLYFDDD